MRNWFKTIILPLSIVSAFAGMTFGGCTSVDDTLGMGLLPDDQEMFFGRGVAAGVRSYLVKPDSIVTSRLGRMLIGKTSSEKFGTTTCGSVMQIVPAYGNGSTTNPYGKGTVIDSMDFVLQIEDIYGDTSVKQKFYIYRLEPDELLDPDKLYYPNYDAEKFIDRGAPLFSFTMKDEKKGGTYKKLRIEPAGEKFLEELVGIDTMIYQQPDEEFRKIFKGLYFAPSLDPAEAPENGAIYDISPLGYTSMGIDDMTFLIVYVHTHTDTPEEGQERHECPGGGGFVRDTLFVTYSMDDSDDYPSRNTSIITIAHDYADSEVDESRFIDPYEFDPSTAVESDPICVQGMVGVSSMLYFSDDFVEQLQELRWFRDANGNKTEKGILVVNKALLNIYLNDMDDVEAIEAAPTRLGMYYNYGGVNPEAIPDYLYLLEAVYTDFRSAYGGYINGPMSNYQMDISMYVKALANDPENTQRNIWLAPAVTIQMKEG